MDKLIPFNKENNHSISEAIFTLFLPNRLYELTKFKTSIEVNGKLKSIFQHFRMLEGFKFLVEIENNVTATQSKNGEDGFQLEGFENGKLTWLIRYQPNNQGLNQLSIHSLNYKGWSNFYTNIFEFLKNINEIDSSIYVSGYSISYVDQFDWVDAEFPPVELIFKSSSKYLPKSIFDSKENWNIVSNFDSLLQEKQIKEHINIGSRKLSEKSYNIYLMHVSNLLLSETESLNNFCMKDNASNIFANELHELNKIFLRDSLSDTILNLIGIKIN